MPTPEQPTGGVRLAALVPADAQEMLEVLRRNRAFLAPFEPVRPAADFTLAGQQASLQALGEARTAGTTYAFGIRAPAGELIGRVTLAQVFRGSFQNCYLGYWVAEDHNGRGYGTRAVELAVGYAFEELGLHRVQANVMTKNPRSARVLQKAGFRKEGLALRYLQIAGRWEDHDMYALTAEDRTTG
ncbi:MAG: GNAT family N-acetyltransferase [Actinomycetota bacterium]|nr:GNAT family N-acetyltransferase [Actinomycetota bacterium]